MKSASIRLLIGLIAGFGVIIFCVSNTISWPEPTGNLTKVFLFKRFFLDALFVSLACYLVYAKPIARKLIAYTIAVVGLVCFYLQFASIDYSGKFVPLVALENAQHFDLIDSNPIFLGLFFLLVYFIALIILVEKSTYKTSILTKLVTASAIIIVVIATKNDYKWIPKKIVSERISLFKNGVVSFENKSPLGKFKETTETWLLGSSRFIELTENDLLLDDKQTKFVTDHNLGWAEENSDYPLIKITNAPPPDGLASKPFPSSPNVIVIFAEGVSARTIQPYSQKFPKLTPNINAFSKEAIRVDKYYNHTFATYRALAGQHCSSFPYGLTERETQYHCLPHILADNGYQTYFAYSQWKAKSRLDEMFLKVGFDSILSVDELKLLPENKGKDFGNNMSDRELFESLITVLRQKESSESKIPFYMGVYNLQTHTGYRMSDKRVQYIRPGHPRAEESYILDGIHNLDNVFGEFWDYFKQSSFYDNTIVIFTSDHAHYPDKDYQKLWDTSDKYVQYFMDRIPLLIYSPFHDQARKFRLEKSSSLDFAPTLLHLLGINGYRSMFLGRSIFDPINRMSPVMMGNSKMYYEKRNNIIRLGNREPNQNYRTMQNMINKTQALELGDRLWNGD